jgi:hypothetical protein
MNAKGTMNEKGLRTEGQNLKFKVQSGKLKIYNENKELRMEE